jgi:hypothetical protein
LVVGWNPNYCSLLFDVVLKEEKMKGNESSDLKFISKVKDEIKISKIRMKNDIKRHWTCKLPHFYICQFFCNVIHQLHYTKIGIKATLNITLSSRKCRNVSH